MGLLHEVNRGRNVIEFVPDILAHMGVTIRTNADLHSEMTSTERYKEAMEKMQTPHATKSS